MNFGNSHHGIRDEWEFEYTASALGKAALEKKEYRQSRVNWWAGQKEQVMAEVKASGLEINESLATTYSNATGGAPQLTVRSDLQKKLGECHAKIQMHTAAVHEYDGWAQVLSANPEARLKLRHGDWLYFFGTN